MKVSFDQLKKVFFAYENSMETDWDGICRSVRTRFYWNSLRKRFETEHLRNAAPFTDSHDQDLKKLISKVSCEVLDPWTAPLPTPKGKQLDRVQRLGVRHILERNHSYLAFEQGIGKTPTTIVALNAFKKRTLILVPPHLVDMWVSEIPKWSIHSWRIKRYDQKKTDFVDCDILICHDSIIDRSQVLGDLKAFKADFIIVEEAQRFVNWNAKRTRALFGRPNLFPPNGLIHDAEKIVFLSGTPMPNRPMELHPILSSAAANLIDYQNFHEFGLRYCAAFESEWGWDYRGASNLDELKRKLRVFMRREVKANLKFVEKKRRVVKFDGLKESVSHFEKDLLKNRSLEEFLNSDFESGNLFGELSKLRSALGEAKLDNVKIYLNKLLKSTKESILLLGWHVDSLESLAWEFKSFKPLVIHGNIPIKKRSAFVKAFQEGRTKLLIANIQTMVGYNLDVATKAIFFEYSWSPKDNEQAEDRIHRRTSKKDVDVEYLVLKDSLDEYILDALLKKKKVIDKVI